MCGVHSCKHAGTKVTNVHFTGYFCMRERTENMSTTRPRWVVPGAFDKAVLLNVALPLRAHRTRLGTPVSTSHFTLYTALPEPSQSYTKPSVQTMVTRCEPLEVSNLWSQDASQESLTFSCMYALRGGHKMQTDRAEDLVR